MKSDYFTVFLLLCLGCSTMPKVQQAPLGKKLSSEELFLAACEPGKNVHSVEGTVSLKANAPEFSGQFPANVSVPGPHQLKIEITNLLGGTEALIQVNQQHYEITETRNKKSKQEGYGSWGGIPLQWASDLFLGKIPCPTLKSDVKLSSHAEGQLMVSVPESLGTEAQEFNFIFKDHDGKPWPESLHWTRLNSPSISVDFAFDDPEEGTLSPKKWEARSTQGAIRIRWRNRNVLN